MLGEPGQWSRGASQSRDALLFCTDKFSGVNSDASSSPSRWPPCVLCRAPDSSAPTRPRPRRALRLLQTRRHLSGSQRRRRDRFRGRPDRAAGTALVRRACGRQRHRRAPRLRDLGDESAGDGRARLSARRGHHDLRRRKISRGLRRDARGDWRRRTESGRRRGRSRSISATRPRSRCSAGTKPASPPRR